MSSRMKRDWAYFNTCKWRIRIFVFLLHIEFHVLKTNTPMHFVKWVDGWASFLGFFLPHTCRFLFFSSPSFSLTCLSSFPLRSLSSFLPSISYKSKPCPISPVANENLRTSSFLSCRAGSLEGWERRNGLSHDRWEFWVWAGCSWQQPWWSWWGCVQLVASKEGEVVFDSLFEINVRVYFYFRLTFAATAKRTTCFCEICQGS